MSENHTSPTPKSFELVTDTLVKKALDSYKGKNAELLSFEVKNFTKKGDNLMSDVVCVEVKYRDENGQHEDSFVAKLNPLRPYSGLSELMEMLFAKETNVLSTVIGGMNSCLGKQYQPPIKTPKLFSRNLEKEKESFIMENLRKQGFIMHDRKKGMDLNHAILVLEELGRFHASSLLLEDVLAPKTFEESFEGFDAINEDLEAFKPFKAMMNTQAANASKFLKNLPKYEKCVKWLDANVENMGKYYIDGLKPKKPFDVLVHGDCWTNNMLFKYDENNNPVDIRFVDLQTSGKSSPACDILYFFYASLSGDLRSKNFQKMLYIYYQSFSKILIFGRKTVPFTFKQLEDEVQNRVIFGFTCAMFLIPGVLGEEDEFLDLGDLDNFSSSVEEKFSLISKREGPFKDRFLAIFDDMLKSKILEGI